MSKERCDTYVHLYSLSLRHAWRGDQLAGSAAAGAARIRYDHEYGADVADDSHRAEYRTVGDRHEKPRAYRHQVPADLAGGDRLQCGADGAVRKDDHAVGKDPSGSAAGKAGSGAAKS